MLQVLEQESVSRQAHQNVEDFIADSANSSLKPQDRPFSKKLLKRSPAEQTETLLAALINLVKCRENFLTKPLTMRDRTQLWLDGIYDIHSNLVVRTMGKRLRICNELAWLMSETDTPEKYAAFRDEWIRKESENQPGPPNTKGLNAGQVAAYEASKKRQAYLGELINLLLVQKSLTLIPEQLELAMYCITERTLQDRSNSSGNSQAIVKPLITYKAVRTMLENFDRNNTADGATRLGYDALVSLDQYCQCLRAGIYYDDNEPTAEGARNLEYICDLLRRHNFEFPVSMSPFKVVTYKFSDAEELGLVFQRTIESLRKQNVAWRYLYFGFADKSEISIDALIEKTPEAKPFKFHFRPKLGEPMFVVANVPNILTLNAIAKTFENDSLALEQLRPESILQIIDGIGKQYSMFWSVLAFWGLHYSSAQSNLEFSPYPPDSVESSLILTTIPDSNGAKAVCKVIEGVFDLSLNIEDFGPVLSSEMRTLPVRRVYRRPVDRA